MKSNKFTWMAALAMASLITLGSAARAEDKPDASDTPKPPAVRHPKAPRAQDRVAYLKEHLNLSDDQVAKLKPLVQDEGKKMRELRNDATLSREDRLSKIKEIHQEFAGKVKPILTPEQYTKWEKLQEAPHKRRTQE